jgi:hypothetical protein
MPEGAGLGLKSVSIFQGGSKQVASLGIVANTAENKLPILIDEPSEICSTKQYIDRNGDQQTGTKDCAAGTTPPQCSTDGGSNCVVDGTIYLAAAKATATAANIKSGVIIAGVLGTATLESHSNCNSNGQQSCVAAGTYFAGTACAADGSNCFLRSYSVPGLQTKKAVDVSTIDSTKMLDSLIVSGVPGTIATKGVWNLTMAFPGVGYYTSTTNTPAAANIAFGSTITGVPGSAEIESHSSCSADGITGCVTTSSYKSADMTSAITGNIKNGATIAGVPGSVTSESHSNCAADGATGCVAVSTYPAALATDAASKILSGQTLAGVAGSVTLPAASDVKSGTISYGAAGTQFTPSYSPDFPDVANVKTTDTVNEATGTLDLTDLLAGNIKSSVTIAGVTGSVTSESHSNCASDGAIGCVTVAGFKSADMSVAIAGNIKSGIAIAGVTGQYPSATYTLLRASNTADLTDLTQATFKDQVKSSAGFEYWDSSGTRWPGAGDDDIAAGNIATGVDIFETIGTAAAGVAPNAWDVRAGSIVNGVTGKLPVNCRNTARSAVYNYDGDVASLSDGAIATGTTVDIWDTIDDYNGGTAGLPSGTVAGWSSSTVCGGIESTVGDSNIWRDVTTTDGTTASTCAGTVANCSYKDKASGLEWSKDSTGTWPVAVQYCSGLTFNGKTGWRLPTQKELYGAYEHGIRATESANFVSNFSQHFWSSSTVSPVSNYNYYNNYTDNAWYLAPASEYLYGAGYFYKYNSKGVLCVRP